MFRRFNRLFILLLLSTPTGFAEGRFINGANDLRKNFQVQFQINNLSQAVFPLVVLEPNEAGNGNRPARYLVSATLISRSGYFVAPYDLFYHFCLDRRKRRTSGHSQTTLLCSREQVSTQVNTNANERKIKVGIHALVGGEIRPVYLVSRFRARDSLPNRAEARGDGLAWIQQVFYAKNLVIGKIGQFVNGRPNFANNLNLPASLSFKPPRRPNGQFNHPIARMRTPPRVYIPGLRIANRRPQFALATGLISHAHTRGLGFVLAGMPERDLRHYQNHQASDFGLLIPPTMVGAPVIDSQGKIAGFVTTLGSQRIPIPIFLGLTSVMTLPIGPEIPSPEVYTLSRNVLFDDREGFFTTAQIDTPLLQLTVGGQTYRLKK